MLPNIINHVALLVDSSGSIAQYGLTDTIAKVMDAQIAYLAQRDRELQQETRVTIYTFADQPTCLLFDRDVLRLPSLREHYHPQGNTALIDTVLKAIEDLKDTSERYGDHAYLVILLSDGENNRNPHLAPLLSSTINGLPSNWTVAAMVPNQIAKMECKRAGFSDENVSVWDTTVRGAEAAGTVMRQAIDGFTRGRAAGVRGTKNLFNLNTANVTSAAVRSALIELSPTQYSIFPIPTDNKKRSIKDFVEGWTKEPYRIGSAYHTLCKPEKVQAGKQICIQHKLTGKVYAGAAARQMLGLPDHEVKVEPAAHPEFSILLQSQSVNRLLVGGTSLLVMK